MFGLRRIEVAVIGLVVLLTAGAGLLTEGRSATTTSFIVATLALGGLAWLVSFSTEQLGERMGPAATGLMQSSLGNLPEFFVVMFALRAGETEIATTAIIGSIFANALFVLGLVIIFGA